MASEPFGYVQAENELRAATVNLTSTPDDENAAPTRDLKASQHEAAEAEAPVSSFDENVLAASRDLVWGSVAHWADESLGKPGAHLADIRRRLVGV